MPAKTFAETLTCLGAMGKALRAPPTPPFWNDKQGCQGWKCSHGLPSSPSSGPHSPLL